MPAPPTDETEFYCRTTDSTFTISQDDWRKNGNLYFADAEIDGKTLSLGYRAEYLHVHTEKKGSGPYLKVVNPSLGTQTHFSEDYDHHEGGIIFWPASMSPMPRE